MKLPRDLAGADLARALCKHYGYRQVNQEAATSSCRLRRRDITGWRYQTIAPFVSGL